MSDTPEIVTLIDGSGVCVVFPNNGVMTWDALRNTISALFVAATNPAPQGYNREERTIDDNPIRAQMTLSPITDSPDRVRVTMDSGWVDLQFAVSKDELVRVLQSLKDG